VASISQDLEKLARLHESGALTDEEFARAKEAALGRAANGQGTGGGDRDTSLGNAANRYVNFQIGMTVVGLILFVVIFATVFQSRLNTFPAVP
jgi:predicted branched-subunit amino acid permease